MNPLNLSLYDKFYVGFQQEFSTRHASGTDYTNPTIKLAFMTPFSTKAAFASRKGTVDKWVLTHNDIHDYWAKRANITVTFPQSIIVDNEFLTGFKILNMRKHWTSNNIVWRISDPRGWECEITSMNLDILIQDHGISKGGIIDEPCKYVRNGSQNLLLPQSSIYWQDAIPGKN